VRDFVENLPRIGVLIKELTTWVHGAVSRLVRTPKPVLTAVNGVAAGGGLALAIAGDLVLAAESARFTMAYSRIAATPDGSSSYWLPRLVGLRRAVELFYTNRVLTAREAMEWGLVTRVVADGELADATSKLAAELAQGPTLALGRGSSLPLRHDREAWRARWSSRVRRSPGAATGDFAEGVRAFTQQAPRASGR
jgi:2-(1,2-epoxy-1,2-dihydrophenyl)acetyl-CoA isomerase